MTSPLFSIEINIDRGTQETLKNIASALETIAQKMSLPSNTAPYIPNIPTDEPTELSVCFPEYQSRRPAEPFTVIRTTSMKGVIWNRITGHQKLMWREDGDWIALLYNESAVKTKWHEVKRLSRISKNRRRMEIQKTLSTKDIDRITAVSVFVSSYLEGLVMAPDEQKETVEDPDAAFKPMVTPYITTRPAEDCGSIESLQGAY